MGDLDILETNKHFAIALFTNFFDAYTSLEFLLDNNSFKEIGDVNFILRWYKNEDEINVSRNFKRKIQVFMPTSKFTENNNKTPIYNNSNNNNFVSNQKSTFHKKAVFKNSDPVITKHGNSFNNSFNYSPNTKYLNQNNMMENFNNNGIQFAQNQNGSSLNSSMHSSYSNGAFISKSPQIVYSNNVNISEFNQSINNNYPINPINNSNSSLINGFYGFSLNSQIFPAPEKPPVPNKKKSGNTPVDKKTGDKVSTEKYTCKYEIQIENNNDFQVAKKLIGCNV